jgi:response regulator RpfG family c-di-GMP phosphodiesterase
LAGSAPVSFLDVHLAQALTRLDPSATGTRAVIAAIRAAQGALADVLDRRLLVVDDDDEVRAVVAELLAAEGYAPEQAATAEGALERARAEHFPLVITDLKLPDQDGLWLLRALRAELPETAVIVMTGYGQVESAVDALKAGAADYLTKPIRVNHLAAAALRALDRRRVVMETRQYQAALEGAVEEKARALEAAYAQISETYRITLEALVTALDARECETGAHSQRVVRFSLAIGDALGVVGKERDDLARGALLHDIGKIGIPDHILLKPARLTPEEWVEMRKHPEIGARILSGIEFLAPAAEIVLAHQERWDGQGYPRGLAGTDIPLGARIFAVADTFDAITTDRPYRKGRPFQAAKDEVRRWSGAQFDPAVVEAATAIADATWEALRAEASPFQTKRR